MSNSGATGPASAGAAAHHDQFACRLRPATAGHGVGHRHLDHLAVGEGFIFPNPFDAAAAIKAPTTIPTEAGRNRYAMRVGFPAGMPAARRMVDEYLMVVATRRPVAFHEAYALDDFRAHLLERNTSFCVAQPTQKVGWTERGREARRHLHYGNFTSAPDVIECRLALWPVRE